MKEQLRKIAEILNASEGKDFFDALSQEDGIALKTIAEMLLEVTNKGGDG